MPLNRLVLALLVSGACGAAFASRDSDLAANEQKLGHLREKISSQQSIIDRMRTEESQKQEYLQGIEKLLRNTEQKLGTLRTELTHVQARHSQVLKERGGFELDSRERESGLRDSARLCFASSAGDSWIDADPVLMVHLGLAYGAQVGALERNESQLVRLKGVARTLEHKKSDLSVQKDKAENARTRHLSAIESESAALKALRAKEKEAEEALDRLVASSKTLEDLIGKLKKRRQQAEAKRHAVKPQASKPLIVPKRIYPWPAPGQIIQAFGKEYSKTLKRLVLSNGVRIRTQSGAELRAVAAGQILFADRFRSYGKLVIIAHPNDMNSVYGGLDEIAVKESDPVSRGDVIGRLRTGSDTFYFEIRAGDQPVNPADWLEEK